MHLVAIGGSDAVISAAMRAGELDPCVEVTVVVADACPNPSVCGIRALGMQAVSGTQGVKVFDLVAARTGLREHEAGTAGYRSAPASPARTTTRRTTRAPRGPR